MRTPIAPRSRPLVTVTAYTGFGTGPPAGITYGDDTTNVSVGTAFQVTTDGLSATKVRVYLTAGAGSPTSGLVGALYTSGGTLLTSAAFGSTGVGWNEVGITPQAVSQGLTYYSAAFFPAGGYSFVAAQFATEMISGPLRFPPTAEVVNGIWQYGAALQFPGNNGAGTWYGVDIEVM